MKILETLKRIYNMITKFMLSTKNEDRANRLTKTIKSVVDRDRYKRGYPTPSEKYKGIKYPDGKHTWCNEAAHLILSKMGFNTIPILNYVKKIKKYHIGWTGANDIWKNCLKALKEKKIEELDEETAQKFANWGVPVLVSSKGIPGKSGHCAIVAPTDEPFQAERGCWIGQAGWYNGFFWRADIFKAKYVEPPKFFLLQMKKGKKK